MRMGGVLRKERGETKENMGGWGVLQQDGKVDKRNKKVKRSEGEMRGGWRFLFEKSCSCFHLHHRLLLQLHSPSHWGLIKGLLAIIHSLSNHLSDMQFHQHTHWEPFSYCTGNTDTHKQVILMQTKDKQKNQIQSLCYCSLPSWVFLAVVSIARNLQAK